VLCCENKQAECDTVKLLLNFIRFKKHFFKYRGKKIYISKSNFWNTGARKYIGQNIFGIPGQVKCVMQN
jgi:hypothetical protein